MMIAEEDRALEHRADEEGEFAFAWEWRALAVSAFWTMPGVLAGALIRLCVPDGGPVSWWMAGCGIIAATLGALLESDHLLG